MNLSTIRKLFETYGKKIADSGVYKKIRDSKPYEFAKDVKDIAVKGNTGKRVAEGLAMGATMAGGSYLANKYIEHDAKKNGIDLEAPEETDEKKKEKRRKYAVLGGLGTAGLTAAALVAGKRGTLHKSNVKNAASSIGGTLKKGFKDQFVTEGKTKEEIDKILADREKELASNGKDLSSFEKWRITRQGKNHLNGTGLLFTTAFPAMSILNWNGKKQQILDQQKSSEEETPEQNEYSDNEENNDQHKHSTAKKVAIAGGSVLAAVGAARGLKVANPELYKKIANSKVTNKVTHPVKSVMEGMSGFLGYGKEGRGRVLKNLDEAAEKSKEGSYTRKLNEFFNDKEKLKKLREKGEVTAKDYAENAKHQKTALLGGIGIGSLMFKPWAWGEEATKDALKSVDKNAYAYDDSQNQEIQ